MINFLRKFRRQNMKSTKYLKYALGEIILVVIGILIALAINQANERHKKLVKEQEYLQSLHNELVNDSLLFVETQTGLREVEAAARRIAMVLEDPKHKITDSLGFISDFRTIINRTQMMPDPVVWQELLNTGNLELIQDRQLIETLYNHYHKVKACQVDYDNNVHYFVLKGRYFDSSILHVKETDDLFDNFKMDQMPRVAVFEILLNSKEFDHVVHGMVSGTIISQLILGGVQESIKKPLAMVKQQLD